MSKPLHVGILAGESSGDILGAGLMQALRQAHPDVRFTGIGGPLMLAEGLDSMVPMERLSVMGLIEPLKRLPELLRIRKCIIQTLLADRPDVFIGIDSPDFNLGVELRLREQGIKTVHYVSPSVWAWRQKRIHKIAKAVDLVLTLFPFEAEFYRQHKVPVAFVGHPLADIIDLVPDQTAARAALNLPAEGLLLAMLPGSRQGEVSRMGPVFLEAARELIKRKPALRILLPCASAERREQLNGLLGEEDKQIQLIDGRSRELMAAADAVVLASGTAALEAMLLKRPMLVCYKMAAVSYFIISRMVKVRNFSLPNLLAGETLVEELVQEQVSATAIADKAEALLVGDEQLLIQRYHEIHGDLRQNASQKACEAILELLI